MNKDFATEDCSPALLSDTADVQYSTVQYSAVEHGRLQDSTKNEAEHTNLLSIVPLVPPSLLPLERTSVLAVSLAPVLKVDPSPEI